MSIFKIKMRLWSDQVQTIRRYYRSPLFALQDLLFGLISLYSNPYRVSRKFLEKRGEEDVYCYGETPLTTYQKIAAECELGPEDVWLDLGAGRGKGCFWIAHFIGCKVIGVEWIPQFVSRARFLQRLFRVHNLQFIQERIEEADLSGVTALYLYGTWPASLDDHLSSLPEGAKVVTVTYPLDSPLLELKKTFTVDYPWGSATAYLHQKLL